jgi:glutamate---cysteine ligase / carboxylate-amine ligase
MPLPFTSSPNLTLGTEVELQIIDPATKDLTPQAVRLLERLPATPRITPEIFQSMIEINTGVCDSMRGIERDLRANLATLRGVGRELGLSLASSGAHPFARYRERIPFPAERYHYLIDRNQWIARRLLIFGLHVHLGMRDGDEAMQVLNGLLIHGAPLLALSASSPFWDGDDTGMASSRITIFEAMPTAGTPTTFGSWTEFEGFYDTLIATGSITSLKDLWWDIRPSPGFGTVEVRICDALPTVTETVALVGLIHCLAATLCERHRAGERSAPPAPWILRENKWRASRWGLDTDIVTADGRTTPMRAEIERLLVELQPMADRLDARPALATIERLLRDGPSYARQRRVYQTSGSLLAVTASLIEELETDLGGG